MLVEVTSLCMHAINNNPSKRALETIVAKL